MVISLFSQGTERKMVCPMTQKQTFPSCDLRKYQFFNRLATFLKNLLHYPNSKELSDEPSDSSFFIVKSSKSNQYTGMRSIRLSTGSSWSPLEFRIAETVEPQRFAIFHRVSPSGLHNITAGDAPQSSRSSPVSIAETMGTGVSDAD